MDRTDSEDKKREEREEELGYCSSHIEGLNVFDCRVISISGIFRFVDF